MVCLSTQYPFIFFKGCLPQILLSPFLNNLSQMLPLFNLHCHHFWNISWLHNRIYICVEVTITNWVILPKLYSDFIEIKKSLFDMQYLYYTTATQYYYLAEMTKSLPSPWLDFMHTEKLDKVFYGPLCSSSKCVKKVFYLFRIS